MCVWMCEWYVFLCACVCLPTCVYLPACECLFVWGGWVYVCMYAMLCTQKSKDILECQS